MLGIQDFDFAEQSAIKCSVPRGTEDDDLPTALQPVSIPRAYQMDIFNKAMRDNVIAILDTGAGKTLIAALLIRHLHNIDAFEKLKRRWSIFLVPKVPLVCQQQKYLAGNLNLRVKAFYGDMSLDTVGFYILMARCRVNEASHEFTMRVAWSCVSGRCGNGRMSSGAVMSLSALLTFSNNSSCERSCGSKKSM